MTHQIHTTQGIVDVTTKETADGVPIYILPSHVIEDTEVVEQVRQYFSVLPH